MSGADSDPDVQLMLAFHRGDDRAFERLYQSHRLAVFRYCARMIGRVDKGEELAQEAFVRVYRARERYTPTARFKTWLFRIATNLCLNERRRASTTRELGAHEPGQLDRHTAPGPGPLRLVQAAELSEAITDAIAGLPERQRAAVVLARYQGCTMAEIGEVLELSTGGVKALLHRARAALRRDLADHLPNEDREEAG